jgi:hypothetical protein
VLKSLVGDLFFTQRKLEVLTVKISYSFFVNIGIRAN